MTKYLGPFEQKENFKLKQEVIAPPKHEKNSGHLFCFLCFVFFFSTAHAASETREAGKDIGLGSEPLLLSRRRHFSKEIHLFTDSNKTRGVNIYA